MPERFHITKTLKKTHNATAALSNGEEKKEQRKKVEEMQWKISKERFE